MPAEKTAKLEGIAAKNFKGLKEVDLDFRQKGHLIIFGGDESAGKSTAMEILTVTLYGKGNCPRQPIRKGETEAWTETRFDDLIARRVFTEKGTSLEVNAKRDLPPQEWLNKLFGTDKAKALSVNPLKLFDMPVKQLIDTLHRAFGLDFSTMDEERQRLYDQRHDMNQEVRNLKERVESIQAQADAPSEPIVVAALLEERKQREGINQKNRIIRDDLAGLRRTAAQHKDAIKVLEGEIKDLESSLTARREKLASQVERYQGLVAKGKKAATKVEKLVDADLEEIDDQIESAEELNTMFRTNQERAKLAEQLAAKDKEVQSLTDQIEKLDAEKAKLITDAEFPVEGLSFDEERVLFNGIDIRQAARNEKIKVAVGLVLALNPKAPAIIIDEGSGLGENSLQVLEELAEKHQKYILVGRTSQGSEVTFLMRDGEAVKDEVVAERVGEK